MRNPYVVSQLAARAERERRRRHPWPGPRWTDRGEPAEGSRRTRAAE